MADHSKGDVHGPASTTLASEAAQILVNEADTENVTGSALAARQALMTKLRAAAFAESVALLMSSPAHRERKIADLSWMLVPPFLANQILMARARQNDPASPAPPVGLVLWAQVSDEIDRRFSLNLDQPMEINPAEWTSGPHAWVIDMIGAPKVATALIDQLKRTTLAGRTFKMRVTTQQGERKILALQGEVPKSAA